MLNMPSVDTYVPIDRIGTNVAHPPYIQIRLWPYLNSRKFNELYY